MAKNKSDTNKSKGSSAGKIILALICVLLIGCVTVFVLVYADIINIAPLNDLMISMGIKKEASEAQSTTDTGTTSDHEAPTMGSSYEVPIPDSLAEYYASISTVFSTVDAATSENVQTEEEVYAVLTERGFTQFPVTTNYEIDGEFCDSVEIEEDSSDKHPYYRTYYVSEVTGVVWAISITNGSFSALPASYNNEHFNDPPIMLSETKMTTSYDATENKFYVIIPFTNLVTLKQIVLIDAATLDTLTVEEIEKL